MARNSKGQFRRERQAWDESKWDDGYLDNRGRFRVYCPDYPGAYKDGYALRAHVVWWVKTGNMVGKGMNIHHVNDNRIDDGFHNLQLLPHGIHNRKHHRKPPKVKACANCSKKFFRPVWKAKTQKCCSLLCHVNLVGGSSLRMGKDMTH